MMHERYLLNINTRQQQEVPHPENFTDETSRKFASGAKRCLLQTES